MAASHDARGFGLLTVLLWLSLLATAALGVALATAAEPPASAALHDRLRLVRGAESAVSVVMAALAVQFDWTTVPGAGVATGVTDGAPGPRVLVAHTFDLGAETNLRTCGRTGPCDDSAGAAVAPARPWGIRNPRWRLVVHRPFAELESVAGDVCRCYLAAWVADDPNDDDADPLSDAPPGVAGHGVVLIRGAAIGSDGAVAEVEALVEQPCRQSSTPCGGIRVQSWGLVRDGVP